MNKLGNQINSITCYSSAELYWDWISLKCLETLLIQVWVWKCNPRCGLGFLFEETGKCFWEGSNSTPFCNNTAQGEAAPLWMQKNKISASLHPPSTGREKPGNLRASTALSSFFCPNIWLLSHIWILRRWSWLMNHPDWLLNTSLLLSLPSSSVSSSQFEPQGALQAPISMQIYWCELKVPIYCTAIIRISWIYVHKIFLMNSSVEFTFITFALINKAFLWAFH